MRWVLSFCFLTACGTDTFSSGDGSIDGSLDGAGDAVTGDANPDVRVDGGCVWCQMPSPTKNDILAISGHSQTEIAIVGINFAFWFNGAGWNPLGLSGMQPQVLRTVSVLDANNIWAGGSDGSSGLLMVGGVTGLNPVQNLNPRANSYNAVVRLASLGHAVGSSGTGAFAWGTPNQWFYGDGTTTYFGIDGEGTNSAVAVGSGKAAAFNGNVWSEMSLSGTHFAVAGNASGGWIVGAGGEIIRYQGSSFNVIGSPTTEDLKSVRVRNGGDMYAVGRKGTIVFVKAGTSQAVLQPSGTMADLNGLWGNDGGLWAVGQGGIILRRP